jgi:hypothetical protein
MEFPQAVSDVLGCVAGDELLSSLLNEITRVVHDLGCSMSAVGDPGTNVVMRMRLSTPAFRLAFPKLPQEKSRSQKSSINFST